ncbi:DUF4350 domain-containing protein [Actinospica robiniae]|uniref:DUF4350 domain-containing protein n=1 Tax=Actinospica robiniae TaxID=304901 RepID=UPI000422D50D|nr:DUF4350 domain-containing protein [Actinospica robiniae]
MSLRGKGSRAALVLAAAALALGPSAVARADSSTLIDPTSNDAMLNILIRNGVEYDTAEDVDEVISYGNPDATLVIDGDEVALEPFEIAELATGDWGRVVILTDDPAVLAAFAPGVRPAGTTHDAEQNAGQLDPSCDQTDAATAGSVRAPGTTEYFSIGGADGTTASASPSASPPADDTPAGSDFATDVTGCYDVEADGGGRGAMMVTANDSDTGGDVVVLGSTTFTEDQYLADDGDAALALSLFGAHSELVWLATSFTEDPNLGCSTACGGDGQPSTQNPYGNGNPTATPVPPPGSANARQVNSLLPHWIWWAVLQLAIAAAALAYWRARRMGRLVGEALPVRVRAAETVEGHANLYRRAAAHGRAAALLRAATARRIAPLLGLPAGPAGRAPQTLVAPLAARLGRTPEEVHAVLAGAVPQTEAELVRLTDQLDRLEQEVRSR